MSNDLRIQKMLSHLSNLTGKDVFLREANEIEVTNLPNQMNSMAQLNDRFRMKEFIPTKEIFHVGRYKYEFKKATPENIDALTLIETPSNSLQLIYVCKEAKSTITFDYTYGDGIVKPSKVTLEK